MRCICGGTAVPLVPLAEVQLPFKTRGVDSHMARSRMRCWHSVRKWHWVWFLLCPVAQKMSAELLMQFSIFNDPFKMMSLVSLLVVFRNNCWGSSLYALGDITPLSPSRYALACFSVCSTLFDAFKWTMTTYGPIDRTIRWPLRASQTVLQSPMTYIRASQPCPMHWTPVCTCKEGSSLDYSLISYLSCAHSIFIIITSWMACRFHYAAWRR